MNMGSAMLVMLAMSMGLAMLFSMMKEEKENSSEEKMSFECGFDSMTAEKMNFSTNFIMVIMMFLVFDIEVATMVPMTMSESNLCMEMSQPILFITILTALLIKEWAQGAIDWSK